MMSLWLMVGILISYKLSPYKWANFWLIILMSIKIFEMPMKYVMYDQFMGGDTVSWALLILTMWVLVMSFLSKPQLDMFSPLMISLILLYIIFFSLDLIMFYISFELVMVPMYLIILFWGTQPERLKSALYMFSYTLVGSLPFLVGLISLSSTKYIYLSVLYWVSPLSGLFLLAFLVKLPMYSLHLWLPKAHVEAPVMGSMILAGILLKLGGYGLIRMLSFFPSNLNLMIMVLGLWGAIISSCICLREIDIKKIIAYSSIHHMGFLLSSLVLMGSWSKLGSMLMMISHGLCSSGLFCSMNMLYERFYTRSLMLLKGMLIVESSFCSWWFLMIMGNMGSPPLIGFCAEILLMVEIIMIWTPTLFLISISLFISVGYSMHLFLSVVHGSTNLSKLEPSSVREYHLMLLHLCPALVLILKIGLSLP